MIDLSITNTKFQEGRLNDFVIEEIITLMSLNYRLVINDGKITKLIYEKQ